MPENVVVPPVTACTSANSAISQNPCGSSCMLRAGVEISCLYFSNERHSYRLLNSCPAFHGSNIAYMGWLCRSTNPGKMMSSVSTQMAFSSFGSLSDTALIFLCLITTHPLLRTFSGVTTVPLITMVRSWAWTTEQAQSVSRQTNTSRHFLICIMELLRFIQWVDQVGLFRGWIWRVCSRSSWVQP